MSHEQFLHTVRRSPEESSPRRAPGRPARPQPPLALLREYYTDPWRARLSGNAFLVWVYLLFKADPESRIATVSQWDIKVQTGIRSNRSLNQALMELRRFRYFTTWDTPAAPYYPRNYKIPEHIGSAQMPEALARELHRQAEQARKRGGPKREPEHDFYAGVNLKAFARPAPANDPSATSSVLQPAGAGLPEEPGNDLKRNPGAAPAGPLFPPRTLRPELGLDQEIARLEKEVEEIGKALGREK